MIIEIDIMKIGIIGSGMIGSIVAKKFVFAGHDVVLSNSRGPETLNDKIAEIGEHASAGSILEAASQQIVLLAVPWTKISAAVRDLPDWNNRIVIDATNQYLAPPPNPKIADLEPLTSSEVVAKALPGARVVKAFNTLSGKYIDGEVKGGRRVLFYAGDDTEAKLKVNRIFKEMKFFPVDMGNLAAGGRIMQLRGPLSGTHFVQFEEGN